MARLNSCVWSDIRDGIRNFNERYYAAVNTLRTNIPLLEHVAANFYLLFVMIFMSGHTSIYKTDT